MGKAHGKSLVVGAGSQTSVAAQVIGLSLGVMTMMVMVTAEIIRL